MTIDPATLPEPVQRFLTALRDNALRVEGWEVKDLAGGKCIADRVAHVEVKDNGTITICDNFERFFATMYDYTPDANEPNGRWMVREMYSDEPAKPYSFELAMADAAIMFTG